MIMLDAHVSNYRVHGSTINCLFYPKTCLWLSTQPPMSDATRSCLKISHAGQTVSDTTRSGLKISQALSDITRSGLKISKTMFQDTKSGFKIRLTVSQHMRFGLKISQAVSDETRSGLKISQRCWKTQDLVCKSATLGLHETWCENQPNGVGLPRDLVWESSGRRLHHKRNINNYAF